MNLLLLYSTRILSTGDSNILILAEIRQTLENLSFIKKIGMQDRYHRKSI